MIKVADGLLALSKRQPGQDEGAEVFLQPEAIAALEPHRTGCYIYAAGQRWDVAHSHAEIAQAIRASRRGR